MLTKEIKQRIDRARDILVGQLPLPSDQIELITIAMIYKFMDDMDEDARSLGGVPSFFIDDLRPFAWPALLSNQLSSADRVLRFTQAIEHLQKAQHIPALFRSIFQNTFLKFRDGRILKMFLDEINGFTYDNSEDLGNAFEYLLMSMGTQAENGQFRTPRHLIDFVVEVVEPELTDSILDPACGTAGFLISAFQYLIRLHTRGLEDYRVSLGNRTDAELARVKRGDKLRPEDRDKKGLNPVGYDITPMMVRLSRVNLYLHRVANPQIHEYDTLSNDHRWNDKFDCILANPPFMTPTGGVQPHSRFRLKANKAEVLFADYILEHLDPYRGKAGIIVPEGIIFQNSRDYVQLRRWLVEEAGLWAVVSLPAHVFQPYSGVKTSILLIDKELTRTGSPTAERTRAGSNILLVKIDNDGYSLNTNRTPVAANDLPAAYQLLHAWKHDQPLPADAGVAHRVVPRADFARLDPYRAATTALDAVRKPFRTLIKPGSEATRQRRIAAFCESVGLDHLPASEADLKAWFDEHLRAAAVAYGAGDEAAELPEELKTTMREAREYSLSYDRYGNEDVTPVNRHWPMVALHELCLQILSGGTPTREKPEFWEGTIPWISSADIINRHTIQLRRFISAAGVASSATNVIPADNIIVVTRVGLGKLARNTTAVAISQDCQGLVINRSLIHPEFLLHCLEKEVQIFKEIGRGVTIKGVTKAELQSIEIPLPPLEIQIQLVTQIETEQEKIKQFESGIELAKSNITSLVNSLWSEVVSEDSIIDAPVLLAAEPKVEMLLKMPVNGRAE
ncbi:N-6 DNA methylase [Hymenobacter sp.]|jgi:type I restriction enzyme M protein|uniref:N-6 DNA methylase n=1 Tax=Hymenobacter sp. TaxID=1898978 RepID=UPI002EDB5CBF